MYEEGVFEAQVAEMHSPKFSVCEVRHPSVRLAVGSWVMTLIDIVNKQMMYLQEKENQVTTRTGT